MKKALTLCAMLSLTIRFFCEAQCPTLTPFIQAIPNTIFPCHGSCDGMLVISPAYIYGTPPYTFTSNYGMIIPDSPNPGWTTITNLCAGQTIVVNITDSAGCTGQDFITLIEPGLLNPTITVTPSCGSLNNGSVTISNIPSWYWLRNLAVTTNDWCYPLWNPGCTGLISSTQLHPGDSTPFIVENLSPGNYYFGISFQMTDYQYPWFGCTQYIPFTIPVTTLPSALITPNGPTTFCSGGNVTLNAAVVANRTYQWKKNGNAILGATSASYIANASGTYKVTVTNTVTGCSKTTVTGIVVTKNALPNATITPQGPTTFCAGGSVALIANTGAGLAYKWKKGNNYIAGATASNYTATKEGTYKVEVTNSYGCTKTSSGIVVYVPCKESGGLISSNEFNVTVNPNPSSGDFVFEIENISDENSSIMIFDVIGKMVLSETNIDANFIIYDSQLLVGVYSVVISNGNERKVIKIVKAQ